MDRKRISVVGKPRKSFCFVGTGGFGGEIFQPFTSFTTDGRYV